MVACQHSSQIGCLSTSNSTFYFTTPEFAIVIAVDLSGPPSDLERRIASDIVPSSRVRIREFDESNEDGGIRKWSLDELGKTRQQFVPEPEMVGRTGASSSETDTVPSELFYTSGWFQATLRKFHHENPVQALSTPVKEIQDHPKGRFEAYATVLQESGPDRVVRYGQRPGSPESAMTI